MKEKTCFQGNLFKNDHLDPVPTVLQTDVCFVLFHVHTSVCLCLFHVSILGELEGERDTHYTTRTVTNTIRIFE